MAISRQFILLFVVWCIFEHVHSISPRYNAGNQSLSKVCGVSRKPFQFSRIVNPSGDAQLGYWPWIGAIFSHQLEGYCGSSLISDRWVLTAAHCVVQHSEYSLYFIRFGVVNNIWYNPDSRYKIDGFIDKIIPHPEYYYDGRIVRNDIALVRLSESVQFSDYVRPICLTSDITFGNDGWNGAKVQIAGWGLPAEKSRYSFPQLKEAMLKIQDRGTCAGSIESDKPETVVCAGLTGSAGCYGDSGGPLVHVNSSDNRAYIMGVASTSDKCNPNGYTVFTRTSSYYEWIKTTMDTYH